MLVPGSRHAPTKGKVAIATRAENHTANLVPELWRRDRLNNNAAQMAMSVPCSRQSTICMDVVWAIAFKLRAAVISVTCSFPATGASDRALPHQCFFLQECSERASHRSYRRSG